MCGTYVQITDKRWNKVEHPWLGKKARASCLMLQIVSTRNLKVRRWGHTRYLPQSYDSMQDPVVGVGPDVNQLFCEEVAGCAALQVY